MTTTRDHARHHRISAVRRRKEGGYALIIFSMLLTVLMIIAALVIDLGNARQQHQQAQGIADAASLSGAQGLLQAPTGLTGTTAQIAEKTAILDAFHAFPSGVVLPTATTAFTTCTTANQFCEHYADNPARAPQGLFYEDPNSTVFVQATSPWPGDSDPSANDGRACGTNDANTCLVRVRMCWLVVTSLGRLIDPSGAPICADATATDVNLYGAAGFTIGTNAADISPFQGTALDNAVLQGLFGGMNLSAAGYQGLVAANVSLGTLAADAGFDSPSAFLDSNVSNLGQAIITACGVCDNASLQVNQLGLPALGSFTVGQYLKFAQGINDQSASAVVNLYSLLQGVILLSDGSNGVSIPAADLNVPGLGTSSLSLKVVQAAQHYAGPVGGPTCADTVPPATSANVCTSQIQGNFAGNLGTPSFTNNLLNIGVGNFSATITGAAASALLLNSNCQTGQFQVAVTDNGLALTGTIPLTVNVLGIGLVNFSATVSYSQLPGPLASPSNTETFTFSAPNHESYSFTDPNPYVLTITPNLIVGGVNLGGVLNVGNLVKSLTGIVTPLVNSVAANLAPLIGQTESLAGVNTFGGSIWMDLPGPSCPKNEDTLTQ